MKKGSKTKDQDMLPEYDFSKAVRNKYAKRYHQGTNIVILDPDVQKHFPNSGAVNQALRSVIYLLKKKRKKAQ